MTGIPIRLTAVATEADLGVTAWVLGQTRAIPDNYLHVEIKEARIDWLNGEFNCGEVVAEAVNDAGGAMRSRQTTPGHRALWSTASIAKVSTISLPSGRPSTQPNTCPRS